MAWDILSDYMNNNLDETTPKDAEVLTRVLDEDQQNNLLGGRIKGGEYPESAKIKAVWELNHAAGFNRPVR